MRKIGSIWVWLARFRHRRGYGVHSPFAFRFLQDVVYEKFPYYAYRELDSHLAWSQRLRQRRGLRLLFRLSNYAQPHCLLLPHGSALEGLYLQEGCRSACLRQQATGKKRTLCYLRRPDENVLGVLDEDSVLVLDDLHLHRQWFRDLKAVVKFDLYDLGIAFFDPKYNETYYIVNF
ncbi:MAG: hypothetical protein IJR87_09290 [Bacteroidaceae bacterium]|nr:hypothetical protein [Bacteroidaceae bacterium]